MVYKAAVIGCHGVGKTTLVKKLENHGFNVFEEVAINSFMGHDSFLSEIKIIIDNILLNKKIKETDGDSVSDRFAFLDAIIYSEGFYKMGWIDREQLKTIYSIVNNSKHQWEYPQKILVMHDKRDLILQNIKKRSRNSKLNEEDEEFLKITIRMFNDFYKGKLDFQFLKQRIKHKLINIPKYKIKCHEEIPTVLNLLNKEK